MLDWNALASRFLIERSIPPHFGQVKAPRSPGIGITQLKTMIRTTTTIATRPPIQTAGLSPPWLVLLAVVVADDKPIEEVLEIVDRVTAYPVVGFVYSEAFDIVRQRYKSLPIGNFTVTSIEAGAR